MNKIRIGGALGVIGSILSLFEEQIVNQLGHIEYIGIIIPLVASTTLFIGAALLFSAVLDSE